MNKSDKIHDYILLAISCALMIYVFVQLLLDRDIDKATIFAMFVINTVFTFRLHHKISSMDKIAKS
jgi:hypothetical protein